MRYLLLAIFLFVSVFGVMAQPVNADEYTDWLSGMQLTGGYLFEDLGGTEFTADIDYPTEIDTDIEKLQAVENLLEQMRLEHNQKATLAVTDWKEYEDKFHTYAEISKKKHKLLLNEKACLMESIRLARYPTVKDWNEATNVKTIQELDAVYYDLYGDLEQAKETTTLATSTVLDELKAINLDSLDKTPTSDPTEDFTTYTETDPDSEITVTADRITLVGFDEGTDAYVYKEGKNFDGDFEHLLQVYLDSASDDYAEANVWAVMNEVGTWEDIEAASGDGLCAYAMIRGAGDTRLYLGELDGGTEYLDNIATLNADTLYFLEIERDEAVGDYGTAYIYICTGNYWDDGGTQVDTLVSQ